MSHSPMRFPHVRSAAPPLLARAATLAVLESCAPAPGAGGIAPGAAPAEIVGEGVLSTEARHSRKARKLTGGRGPRFLHGGARWNR